MSIRGKELQYYADALDFVIKNEKLNSFENVKISNNVRPKFEQSTTYEDTKLAFDFVCRLDDVYTRHFAFRCRNSFYITTGDIAIRSKTDTGNSNCEMQKINNGLGQYYIYYVENKQENSIILKLLIDIEIIRSLYKQGKYKPIKMESNGEITTFKIDDIRALNGIIDEYDVRDILNC